MDSNKPHLCFVAPAAWPILSGDRSIKSVGGAEVQMSNLARAFAKAGNQVSMICMDYGQPDGVEIDGVRVFKAHTPDGGLPVVRFIYPRFTSIWRAMKLANADIYYQRSCGVHTGIVAAFCKKYRRRFVYAAAHDGDFDPAVPLIRYRRDKAIYRWGLRNACSVVVQNPTQAIRCHDVYGISPTAVRSCYAPPVGVSAKLDGYVLWVATLRTWKQPELFIELARRLPRFNFHMVGGADGSAEFERLKQSATVVPNLTFVGFVPHAEIEAHFNGARLFVNTSQYEGFPNTFLQAWARGIPTVSFVDTGSLVETEAVVQRAVSIDQMAEKVEKLMVDTVEYQRLGKISRSCFEVDHSVAATVLAYERVFARCMER